MDRRPPRPWPALPHGWADGHVKETVKRRTASALPAPAEPALPCLCLHPHLLPAESETCSCGPCRGASVRTLGLHALGEPSPLRS